MPTSKTEEFKMMPAMTADAGGNWNGGKWDEQPMPSSISPFDRLKAIGLVALVGTSAVATALLGHAIWNLDREETLLPISDSSGSVPPLRDRMPVITPERPDNRADASPPQSVLSDATPNPRSRQSNQASLPRQNHGFGDLSQPSASPSDSQDPSRDAISPKATPETSPAFPTIAAPATTPAKAPSAATAARSKSLPLAFPLAEIAALLQSPQKSPSAIANKPTSSVAVQPGSSSTPSRPAQPPSSTNSTPSGSSSATPPASPQIAAPAQAPPAIAIGQQPPRKDGVYVERLTMTGSTRFSPN